MSADPFTADKGVNPSDVSSGNIIKTFLYTGGQGGEYCLFTSGATQGYRVADQYTIPPYMARLSFFHPCYRPNKNLDKCNQKLHPDMKLAGRCASCNNERHELMKCLTKHKYSHPVPTSESVDSSP